MSRRRAVDKVGVEGVDVADADNLEFAGNLIETRDSVFSFESLDQFRIIAAA